MSKPRSAHSDSAQSDRVQLLYHHSLPAGFVSILASILYAAALWQQPNQQSLIIWLSVLTLFTLIHLLIFIRYPFNQLEDDKIFNWELPFLITLFFPSITWGIGLIFICKDLTFVYQSISFYFLAGMSAGAISFYSSFRYIVLIVVSALLLPITIWAFFQSSTLLFYMALASCLLMLSTIRASTITATTLHDNFLIKHKLTQAKARAEELARTDMLTGINNRRAFTELTKQQLQYSHRKLEPVSMLVLDLDLFKHVNDIHGHAAGDYAIQHFAKIISDNIRSSDICGRIGGEEFAILLPNTELTYALEVAEKVRTALESNPVHTPERTFPITTSIGVSSNHYGLETLLQMADKAMYKAKKAGRNQVKYIETDQFEKLSL